MQCHTLSAAVATALLVLLPDPARAQTSGGAADVTRLDAISVIGQGETRQVQRLSEVDKQVLPPGTSGQKLLERLPGVAVQSNDPFGANEESQNITVRGFGKNRLGYTLDGIPLGDNSYGNYNGLSIARAIIAENLGSVELSQGIGSLGVASTSNLGGTIQYISSDPSAVAGGRIAQMLGSDHNRRTFLRVDSGDHRGFAAYLSGVHQDADTWAAPHENQTTRQWNGKALWDVGPHRLSAYLATSRVTQSNFSYLSKDMLARGLGWDWNIYAPDWDRALAAAYCAPATFDAERCGFSGGVNNINDAYFRSRALRNDDLYALSGDFALGDAARVRVQGYHHENAGQGHWWAPGQPSFPGTDSEIPISIRSTNYAIDRDGFTAALNWTLGAHELEVGLWWEDNTHDLERNFYWIDGPVDDDAFLTDPARRVFDSRYRIRTRQFHVQDRMRFIDDRLTVDLGFKSPDTETRAQAATDVEQPIASGTLTAKRSFLPQAGIGWQIDTGRELFGSYARNIASFSNGPLSVTQQSFDAARDLLEPEESRTAEIGYRQIGQRYQASLALYNVDFDNRLLSINPCSSIEVGTRPECITQFVNVGSVRSQGAELTLIVQPAEGLSWHNALSWNRSTYEDDYVEGGAVTRVAGQRVVEIPGRMFSSELAWRSGGWHAALRGNYTGPRTYTYTNDQWVGGTTMFELGAGYTFGERVAALRNVALSLNVTNLTDKRAPAALGAFAPSDPDGLRQAFHATAPRQAFVTLSAEF